MKKIIYSTFGDNRRDFSDMLACQFYLMELGQTFTVADDRGGSSSWMIIIQDDWSGKDIPAPLKRFGFIRKNATATIDI